MARKKKVPALVDVPQTTAACSGKIRRIGELRRELKRRQTILDDAIAVVTAEHAEAMKPMQEELGQAEAAVQAFCEGRRALLTQGNKVKFYRFDAGEISWRSLPPAVSIRDVKRVVSHCLANKKLRRFLRFADPKPDKEAMLKEQAVAVAIPGRVDRQRRRGVRDRAARDRARSAARCGMSPAPWINAWSFRRMARVVLVICIVAWVLFAWAVL